MRDGTVADYCSFAWHYLRNLCQIEVHNFKGHLGPVYACKYATDGRLLASAGEDGKVCLWEPSSGSLVRSWPAHATEIAGLAFSADGKWLATCGPDATAVWEVASGNCLCRFDTGHHALAFTPDNQTLIVAGSFNMEFWDTATWSRREELVNDGEAIRLLAVSPDGTHLAVAGDQSSIQLWQLANRTLIATLAGHARSVSSIAFSHDGAELGQYQPRRPGQALECRRTARTGNVLWPSRTAAGCGVHSR